MTAARLYGERKIVGEDAFVEIVIWDVPRPVPGSEHGYKYSLALIVDHRCVLRYDNERGKGDHRHIGGREAEYSFQGLAKLLADFWRDAEDYLNEHRNLQRPLE